MIDDLKNNDINVYDDFFLEKDFKDFEDHIVYNGDFPWFLAFDSGKTVHNDHNIIRSENVIEYLQFIHILFKEGETEPNSDYYKLFEEKIPFIMNKLKLNNIEVLRAKLNLQTQITNNKPHFHNTPHIDAYYKHNVFMLYLNDSDGDTIFVDDDKNIVKRVTPKKNRVVVFNGMNYHAGSHPYKSNKRLVLNVNYK